jgi:BarA-like signal transduction histidine kinase
MKVGILECGIGLEPHLLKYFEKNHHFAKIISGLELLEALPLSFLPPQNFHVEGETRYDCYVLHIGSAVTVEKTIEVSHFPLCLAIHT